jgi:lysosomal-trafficking regulator
MNLIIQLGSDYVGIYFYQKCVAQVLNHVIRPDMLLAMANHTDYRVRTAVVRVLSAYLQRAADEEINKFLKMKGFYLLANQLSQFEATVELVESCISLVTRCQVGANQVINGAVINLRPLQMSVEEQTELCSLKDLTAIQLASFPPLLSLLPRSVCDTALCHNIIFFLREVITKVSLMLKICALFDQSWSFRCRTRTNQSWTVVC